ncbi:MAG: ferritin [Verrucomicrobiota bacterium]|nr:ferritin [Limisphaera sp.]MDW8381984.1 ferritin [Verrucomicrobiota bacterium]
MNGMSESLRKELNRQFNHELMAAHHYEALAWWCTHRTLPGFARFFRKQAGEEREHADRIGRHLIDRGVEPRVEALPAPESLPESLLEVARYARRLEQNNSRGIHAAYEAALAARDYPAQVMLHWFIREQVEEEAWTAEMVGRVEAADCAGALLELDRHIEKLLEQREEQGD